MASGNPLPPERLTPCLFDWLIDEEPKNKTVESRSRRVVNFEEYKKAVMRDLGWLLNCNSHLIEEHFSDFPQVGSSVVNYGMQSLAGMEVSGLNVENVAQVIARAVKNFEPRIMEDTLEVILDEDAERQSKGSIAFKIRGELWARPYPERLFIKTEFDLGTGIVSVEKM